MGSNKLDSPYFIREEFACRCGCGFDTVDSSLLVMMTAIRHYFDKPVVVHSGARCKTHNQNSGGGKNSQHLIGRACDFHVKDVSLEEVMNVAEDLMDGWGGLGYYPESGFVHVDTRSGKMARWRE